MKVIESIPETSRSISKNIDKKGKKTYYANEKKIDRTQLKNLHNYVVQQKDLRNSKKRENIQSVINKLIKKYQLEKNTSVLKALYEGRSTITASFTIDKILKLAKNEGDLIERIGLYKDPTDGMVSAMAATRVDELHYEYASGSGVGIYMTESGCPNTGFLPNYYKISGNRTDHSELVLGVLSEAAPDAFKYCRHGNPLLPPSDTDLKGYSGNPAVYITTTSAGDWEDYGEYVAEDREWDNLVYDKLISTYVLAHNGNYYVCSPGKGLNVITVGSYNDATNVVSDFSNWKDPDTGNDKPELCAPGEDITAAGHTDEGTSFATPHVVGIFIHH